MNLSLIDLLEYEPRVLLVLMISRYDRINSDLLWYHDVSELWRRWYSLVASEYAD